MRAHTGQQQRFIHRLGDEIHRPRLQPEHFGIGLAMARHKNDRDIGQRSVSADGVTHFIAAHARHLCVQQHQIGGRLTHQFQRLIPPGGKTQAGNPFEHARHQLDHAGVVVHDQNALAHAAHLGGKDRRRWGVGNSPHAAQTSLWQEKAGVTGSTMSDRPIHYRL